MAKGHSKKHLLWLIPLMVLLLLAVALAGGLTIARRHGWHWRNPAWEAGPVLGRLTWYRNGCRQLIARDIRLRGVWPLRLSIASVTVPSCGEGSGGQSGTGFGLPAAPPLDVVVRALQFRGYPPLRVAVHHRGAHWRAHLSLKGSGLHIAYEAASGRWRLAGRIDVGRLSSRWSGRLIVQGDGYWHPGADKPAERFGGRLRIAGKHLGRTQRGPYGDLVATMVWQGRNWTLDAALSRPLALGKGWVLQPGRGLHIGGTGGTVDRATMVLAVHGPRAQAVLSLQSDAGNLASGRGTLTLSRGVTGRIHLSWADGKLTVPPFSVTGPAGAVLALNEAVTVPLAPAGTIMPALSLRYGGAEARTAESHLSWSGRGIRWHGTVVLDGRWQGYRLGGRWFGTVNSEGLHGKPLTMTLDGAKLHLRARLPVGNLWPPGRPVTLQLKGRFRGVDLTAAVSAKRTGARWGGHIQARSHLPRVEQGGELIFNGRWQWRGGPVLLAGARLTMARALKGAVLIQPIEITAVTPVTFHANGIRGRLHLEAEGFTAARWGLPPVQADLAFPQGRIEAALRIPEWNAALTVTGRDLAGTPQGTFSAKLPLQPAISRGLDAVTREGVLTANGHWRAGSRPAITGRFRARHVRLDWGSIAARGIQADVQVRWQPGSVRIGSRVPLTIARLDAGVTVTGIRLALETDLHTWRFHDIRASLLGGRLSAKELTWPSPQYQPVVLTDIDAAQLVALQSLSAIHLSGQLGGTIPLRLERDTLSIRNGRLKNETPLWLSISSTDRVRALQDSHPAVAMALDVLSPLRIEKFIACIDMSADGWLKAAITIKGINPLRELPIILHYTHRENMFELLRSLRIGSRVVDAIIENGTAVVPPALK